MECPKLCSTNLIPELDTFKIKSSKVDFQKISDNVGFQYTDIMFDSSHY